MSKKSLLMDENGDLAPLDKNGIIKINNDLYALKDKINTVLRTIKGELDSGDVGVDYINVIFAKVPFQTKVIEFSRAIQAIPEVKEVMFVGAQVDSTGQTMTFIFNVQSIYGDIAIERTVDKNSL